MNLISTLSVSVAFILCSMAMGQDASGVALKSTASSNQSRDGLDKLTDVMSKLLEKRNAHTAEVRSLKSEVERQTRSGEFPAIEKEIEELVGLEKKYRGQRTGALVITHITYIASSYGGTERPIHRAL